MQLVLLFNHTRNRAVRNDPWSSHRVYLFCTHGADAQIRPDIANGHVLVARRGGSNASDYMMSRWGDREIGPWSYSRHPDVSRECRMNERACEFRLNARRPTSLTDRLKVRASNKSFERALRA
jgi:hypothetical protein